MAKSKRIGGLGKGLNALIPLIEEGLGGDDGDENRASGRQTIELARISLNPYQPRRHFDEDKMAELTASIREHGVVQPILVRPFAEGYQLIAGERRLRAARQAGLEEIPALVRELTDNEMMEISLIENIQRQDLGPVEEARAYKRLSDEFALTQEQIAKRVSKSRPYIANSVRLLQLPEVILDQLSTGALTAGHARPLLGLREEDAVMLAARLVAEKGTAREAELWAKELAEPKNKGKKQKEKRLASGSGTKPGEVLTTDLKEIQRILREAVRTKVEISPGAKGGKIIIDYYTQDDVERILELLTGVNAVD